MAEPKLIVSRETARAIGEFLSNRLPDGYSWVLCVTDNNDPVSRTTTLATPSANRIGVAAFLREQADQMERGEQPEFHLE